MELLFQMDFKNIKMFNKFIVENPGTENIDAIVFLTNYTDRIIEDECAIKKLNPDVVLTDKIWNPELKPYISGNKESQTIFKIIEDNIADSGAIAFIENDIHKTFDILEELEYADYCSCCNVSNIIEVEWFRINGKTILCVDVDTESG